MRELRGDLLAPAVEAEVEEVLAVAEAAVAMVEKAATTTVEAGVEGMVSCLIPTNPTGTIVKLSGPSSPMSRGSKLERLGNDTMKPEEGLLLQLALAATTAAIIMATMATTMEMLLRLQPRLQPMLLPSSRLHLSGQQPQQPSQLPNYSYPHSHSTLTQQLLL